MQENLEDEMENVRSTEVLTTICARYYSTRLATNQSKYLLQKDLDGDLAIKKLCHHILSVMKILNIFG